MRAARSCLFRVFLRLLRDISLHGVCLLLWVVGFSSCFLCFCVLLAVPSRILWANDRGFGCGSAYHANGVFGSLFFACSRCPLLSIVSCANGTRIRVCSSFTSLPAHNLSRVPRSQLALHASGLHRKVRHSSLFESLQVSQNGHCVSRGRNGSPPCRRRRRRKKSHNISPEKQFLKTFVLYVYLSRFWSRPAG